jgi:2-C-methyl-D-erythritol 4-phosphate cytidylyltransferase
VLRAVQTPQGFRRDVLVAAHAAAVDEHTDDAGLAEKIGVPVQTVPGDEAALKITRPADLRLAELYLRLP